MTQRLKDPIFGEHMDVKLTPTEYAAHGLQLQEHKQQKCDRCTARYDLADGGLICMRGQDIATERRKPGQCRRFKLEEDQDKWKY